MTKHLRESESSAEASVLRLLAIDDDPEDLFFLRRMLADAHAPVQITAIAPEETGRAGDEFDCCMLDYHLPGGDAFDLLAEHPHLIAAMPVIVMTAGGAPLLHECLGDYRIVNFIDKTQWNAAYVQAVVQFSVRLWRSERQLRRQRDLIALQERRLVTQSFASGIAHQFNNINASLLMQLESLQLNLEQERHRASVERCLHSIDRSASLIEQLLRFQVGEAAGAADLTSQVESCIDDVLSFFAYELSRQGVACKRTGSENLRVQGGGADLRHVLYVLVENALHAMRGVAAPELRIETARCEAGQVRVTLADNGIGMDEAELARALHPFFTQKGGFQRKAAYEGLPGTGLGLALADQLLRQAGGELRLHSVAGAGTVCEILLRSA